MIFINLDMLGGGGPNRYRGGGGGGPNRYNRGNFLDSLSFFII